MYNVLVKVQKKCGECGNENSFTWEKVRPTHGAPYEWTKEIAEEYIETYSKTADRSGIYARRSGKYGSVRVPIGIVNISSGSKTR
ncbi:MAG: hypothetical protein IPM48_14700 [Saprospiraceae bacterium]|nr:hypothetical protein [Saprospiraceae bacterium]